MQRRSRLEIESGGVWVRVPIKTVCLSVTPSLPVTLVLQRQSTLTTTADVYIDISPFYGMAPATVSGYRSGGRRYA